MSASGRFMHQGCVSCGGAALFGYRLWAIGYGLWAIGYGLWAIGRGDFGARKHYSFSPKIVYLSLPTRMYI